MQKKLVWILLLLTLSACKVKLDATPTSDVIQHNLATPTAQASLATECPICPVCGTVTPTSIPPTSTMVPPTATNVPPTATRVPPTATTVPGTPTPTATVPAASNPLLQISKTLMLKNDYMVVFWNGISNPTTKDWLGIYKVGASDTQYNSTVYNNTCNGNIGSRTLASSTCVLQVPGTEGNYEVRMFSNGGYTKIATSSQFQVVSSIANLTPSPTPTKTPTPSNMPFIIQSGSPAASQNFAHSDNACNWFGVAGQIFDSTGQPSKNLVISVKGKYDGYDVDLVTLTGFSTALVYGPGGYEVEIGARAVASVNQLTIQLFDINGTAMSDPIQFSTFADCNKNLIVINFKQK